jgi:hypothetical protein
VLDDDPQVILCILEFAFEVFFDHTLAVSPDIQPPLGHLAHFVLSLRDQDGHVSLAHEGDFWASTFAAVPPVA